MKKYDIFLSYRRQGGWETAKHLYDLMTRDGYSVSFDIDTLREGLFDVQLLRRIDECSDFIVILDEHVFDRTTDDSFPKENDWLRIELAYAIEHKKNIIPIMLGGFKGFPTNLPDDIKKVQMYNGPKFDNYYFDTFYDNLLHKFIHSKPKSFVSAIKRIPFNKIINRIAVAIVIFFAFIVLIATCADNEESNENDEGEEVSVEEMYNEGSKYYYGEGVAQDYKQAVYWFQKAAERGNDNAMNNIGACYDQGKGVAQDYKQAAYWYNKAVEKGNAVAMNNLGLCYYNSKGVAQDYKQAVYWYQKAVEKGYVVAMYNLGVCYDQGKGVAQDYKQAAYWYNEAAERGNDNAMNNIGICYEKGRGVAQDYRQAVYWYQKAAEKGDAVAMKNLGVCYKNGNGVAKDREIADKLFKASDTAKAGDEARAIEMVKDALR